MKQTAIFLTMALLAAPLALRPQATTSPSQTEAQGYHPERSDRVLPAEMIPKRIIPPPPPLSRIAIGGSVSPLGPQLLVATNLSRHFNLRATGSYFSYATTFTTSGVNAAAALNLASAGASLDIYPFRSGFRLSPGALFYNQNRLTAIAAIPGGTSFKLNGNTYYSATADPSTGAVPLTGSGRLGLNTYRPAFTATAGWGNVIPASGRHWSFPFEVGVAFIGVPSVSATLGGWVCLDQAQTMCYDFATDPAASSARADLVNQVAKWKSDANPLQTYPIISFGVAYNFKIR